MTLAFCSKLQGARQAYNERFHLLEVMSKALKNVASSMVATSGQSCATCITEVIYFTQVRQGKATGTPEQ